MTETLHHADVVSLEEHFAIVADSDRAGAPRRVLKHGDTFGVFDLLGDIVSPSRTASTASTTRARASCPASSCCSAQAPLLLSSTISEDNTILAVDLTNPDVVRDDHLLVARGSLHIFRARTLWNGHSVERIGISNHSRHPIQTPLALHFDADFADVFEVRGTRRERRGQRAADHAVAPIGACCDTRARPRRAAHRHSLGRRAGPLRQRRGGVLDHARASAGHRARDRGRV